MEKYVLIESRDPFTARDVDGFLALAGDLADRGHPVTLFLVQNGVLAARRGPGADPLARLRGRGVRVLADDFALRERGIATDRLGDGIDVGSVGEVVDELADGARTLWS